MKKLQLFLLAALLPLQSLAREVVFDEKPLPLRLPIGKETIIKFPQAVAHISVLSEAADQSLNSFLTPEGVIYLTPDNPFEKARVVVEQINGKLIMLDITASDRGPFDGDTTIIEKVAEVTKPAPKAMAAPEKLKENPYKPDFLKDGEPKTLTASPTPSTPGYHQMVQFGFRHFVGPSRLIGPDLGSLVTVSKGEFNSIIRIDGARLSLKPLKQWEIQGHYLTVILVNNRSHKPYEFDPRAIRGRWVFAAALHPRLDSSGSQRDQTLWALISMLPFEQAIHR